MKIKKIGPNNYNVNVNIQELLNLKSFITSRIKECQNILGLTDIKELEQQYLYEIEELQKIRYYLTVFTDKELKIMYIEDIISKKHKDDYLDKGLNEIEEYLEYIKKLINGDKQND